MKALGISLEALAEKTAEMREVLFLACLLFGSCSLFHLALAKVLGTLLESLATKR